jgi:glycosidase
MAGRLSRFLIPLLLLGLLVAGCQPQWEDVQSAYWGDDAVFYQIFVRSFYDSDGDGTGDFNGITAKLDYLNDGDPRTTTDLGVTGIWLMPVFPSPSYHGYDVTDYRSVNRQYGTLDEFKTLIAEAHRRGIRVILDFVINHTSARHPWFGASTEGEEPYTGYYVWSAENPGFSGPWGQGVWHRNGDRYYYGVFSGDMPDLNFTNQAVTGEVEQIAAFWLQEIGVDGFRVDGAKHLIEEGQAQENTRATHAWLKAFNRFYKSLNPDTLVVGEVWSSSNATAEYVNQGEFDLVFNFDLAEAILSSISAGDASRLNIALAQQARVFDPGRYATFLSNHDQERTMTRLKGDVQRAKAAATILLTSPGTPFLYYGEEIGMTGSKPDPSLRTPMQWSADENAGFTTGIPWQSARLDYAEINVQAQMDDEESLLSHYRRLIRIRGNHYALRTGQYLAVTTGDSRLFAMLRVAEKESILVLVNLSGEVIANPSLSLGPTPLRGTLSPILLLGTGNPQPLTLDESGRGEAYRPLPEIPANASLILQYKP